jgi:succinate dehydrogenase/fumarate reductase flavoprotein subunit
LVTVTVRLVATPEAGTLPVPVQPVQTYWVDPFCQHRRKYNIDIRKEPMLVFPTLHYQNGGVEINPDTETNVPGLLCAGEVCGGVHGKNRLMGNSQLDLYVFGRRAGRRL